MSSELKELYKQTLLKHSKAPSNEGAIDNAKSATLRNPLCGDEVTVFLRFSDNKIEQVAFTGQCCAICTASASMMTLELDQLAKDEAQERTSALIGSFKSESSHAGLTGELSALAGVFEFPSRIRCATLPWEATAELLQQD